LCADKLSAAILVNDDYDDCEVYKLSAAILVNARERLRRL